MEEDEKKYGLDIPGDVECKKSTNNTFLSGGERAKALMYLTDQKLVGLNELLRQIELGSHEFLHDCQDHGIEKGAAVLCKGIASGLRGTMEDDDNSHTLILLGYLYGGLSSPNSEEYHGVVKKLMAHKAGSMKGGKNAAVEKQIIAAQRKAKAKEIWNELAAKGRSTRELAGIVAKRMGVAPKTVREWRRTDWL